MNVTTWYSRRSATEKGALISGAFLVVITILTITYQRSEIKLENQLLRTQLDQAGTTVHAISAERDNALQRLAPFEAIAAKSFPNDQDRKRLDLLIQSIEELNKKYGSFELRRTDVLDLQRKAAEYAKRHEQQHNSKPTTHLCLYAAASDASGRFFEQLRGILLDAGWSVTVHVETMAKAPQSQVHTLRHLAEGTDSIS